jgi:hypothetical protein
MIPIVARPSGTPSCKNVKIVSVASRKSDLDVCKRGADAAPIPSPIVKTQ